MTNRRIRRKRQIEQKRRRTLMWIVGGVSVAVLLVVVGVVLANRSNQPVEVALPETLSPPPNADGSAWGPPDAPVVIKEFSDFQ